MLDTKKVKQWVERNGVRCYTPIDDYTISSLIFPSAKDLSDFGASPDAVGVQIRSNREFTQLFMVAEF